MNQKTAIIVAVTVSSIATAALTHLLNRKATNKLVQVRENEAHDEGWHKGFTDGWDGAGTNFHYVKERYEYLTSDSE